MRGPIRNRRLFHGNEMLRNDSIACQKIPGYSLANVNKRQNKIGGEAVGEASENIIESEGASI